MFPLAIASLNESSFFDTIIFGILIKKDALRRDSSKCRCYLKSN